MLASVCDWTTTLTFEVGDRFNSDACIMLMDASVLKSDVYINLMKGSVHLISDKNFHFREVEVRFKTNADVNRLMLVSNLGMFLDEGGGHMGRVCSI